MIFGFLLAVCFNPYIFGAATAPRWALLAISLPVLIATKPQSHLTVLHILGLSFIAWAILSLSWTPNLPDGLNSSVQLAIIAMSFVLGARTDLQGIFKGLAIGIAVSSVIVTLSLKSPWIISTEYEGLFGNRNMLAEAAVLAAIGCIGYRLWWFVPGLLPAIFIPGSRGAVIALAAALSALYGPVLWQRSKALCVASFGLVCAAASVAISNPGRLSSFYERASLWTDTLHGLTFFGSGLGSFLSLFPYYSTKWNPVELIPEHAHNDILELAFELGIVGVILYAAIIAVAYRMAAPAERAVLVGFFTIGLVSFPWHIPTTAFIAALVLGRIASRGIGLRQLNLRLRMAVRPWQSRHTAPGIVSR